MDSKTKDMVELAATIRKAVSFPAYRGGVEAHTDGMAELISHTTGLAYHAARKMIVAAAEADPRTTAEASQALIDRRYDEKRKQR